MGYPCPWMTLLYCTRCTTNSVTSSSLPQGGQGCHGFRTWCDSLQAPPDSQVTPTTNQGCVPREQPPRVESRALQQEGFSEEVAARTSKAFREGVDGWELWQIEEKCFLQKHFFRFFLDRFAVILKNCNIHEIMTSSDMRTAPMNFIFVLGYTTYCSNLHRHRAVGIYANMNELQRFIAAKPNR